MAAITTTTTTPPSIHAHDITGPDEPVVAQALRLLRPHLPVSLPLYRRLQFGRFFDATRLLTNHPDLSPPSKERRESHGPWFIAFVDRSCRPETEVWFFGSWETETPAISSTTTTTSSSFSISSHATGDAGATNAATAAAEGEKVLAQQDAVMRAFAQALRTVPIPDSVRADAAPAAATLERDTGGFSRDEYGGHAADPNVVLCGAVHRRSVAVLRRTGLLTGRFKIGLVDNHTYLFHVDRLPAVPALAATLRFGTLTAADFALVKARTQIPRQVRTLAVLPSVGIFEDGAYGQETKMVAWAFVGLDGSLTSLHVEPEWRGKGLAKAVTKKLFEEKMDLFWEEGLERWAHGFVQVGNDASCRVCNSLGGQSDWEVGWARVDLGVLG